MKFRIYRQIKGTPKRILELGVIEAETARDALSEAQRRWPLEYDASVRAVPLVTDARTRNAS